MTADDVAATAAFSDAIRAQLTRGSARYALPGISDDDDREADGDDEADDADDADDARQHSWSPLGQRRSR